MAVAQGQYSSAGITFLSPKRFDLHLLKLNQSEQLMVNDGPGIRFPITVCNLTSHVNIEHICGTSAGGALLEPRFGG